jgi:hypothetical protein
VLAVEDGVRFRRLRGAVKLGQGGNPRAVLEVVLTDVDKAKFSQFWAGGEGNQEKRSKTSCNPV